MTYHEPTRRTFTFRGNEWLIYPRGESYFAKFVKYDSDTGPFSTFEQAYDFARRAMTRTVSPSPEQLEFDGECHLTEAEALQAADALESTQSEIARLTTALQKIAECAEEEASDRGRQTKLFAIAAMTRADLKDSPNVGT
jgi:hypothetical protein